MHTPKMIGLRLDHAKPREDQGNFVHILHKKFINGQEIKKLLRRTRADILEGKGVEK